MLKVEKVIWSFLKFILQKSQNLYKIYRPNLKYYVNILVIIQ